MRHKYGIWFLSGLLLISGAWQGFLLGMPPSSAQAAAPLPNRPAVLNGPCAPGWSIVASPNVGPGRNILRDVAVLNVTDAWAVGYHVDDFGVYDEALIEHWDGSSWSVVPSPWVVGADSSYLNSISAVSATDIWAVGFYESGFSPVGHTLVEHWDGTAWQVVPSPNDPHIYVDMNYLKAVTAISGTDVWAVGQSEHFGGLGGSHTSWTLTTHWDGKIWSLVPSPSPGYSGAFDPQWTNDLTSVTALSATDVWAAGFYRGDTNGELFLRWNGSQWSQVAGSLGTSTIRAIGALSSLDIWAVGALPFPAGGGLTKHWNGASWGNVANPATGTLTDVAVISANDVWAVGMYQAGHWNGTTWTLSALPVVASGRLEGVAAVSANELWSVGSYYNTALNQEQTLIEHYSGSCPTATPIPTPTITPKHTKTPTPKAPWPPPPPEAGRPARQQLS